MAGPARPCARAHALRGCPAGHRIGGMKPNEGTADRVIRAVIAIVAAIAAWQTTGALSIILWILAAVMALTAVTGFCGLYRLFGISTCKVRQ